MGLTIFVYMCVLLKCAYLQDQLVHYITWRGIQLYCKRPESSKYKRLFAIVMSTHHTQIE